MEIYPERQLAMLLGAFLVGIGMGVMWELLTATRILLGAYRPPESMRSRYARPLPLLGRAVPFEKRGAGRHLWHGAVIAVGDCLFCLLFAMAVILLLYGYNDGAFRLSVPVLAVCGFGLFRSASVLLLAPLMAYLAYGFAVALLYLRALLAWPPKALWRLVKQFCYRPLCTLCQTVARKRAFCRSQMLCNAQLRWAEQGFYGPVPHVSKKKGRMRPCPKRKPRVEPNQRNG